jgi:hypothetical protein
MVASQASRARRPFTMLIVAAAYTFAVAIRPRIGYPGSW